MYHLALYFDEKTNQKLSFLSEQIKEKLHQNYLENHHIPFHLTMLHGQTGYLLENTEVLINVISTRELVQVERLVKSIDEDAFMIISNVHEVQGRGFNLEKEYIEK